MSVNSADIYGAVNDAWDASSLDTVFIALRPDPTVAGYPVLHDSEASPGQPLPYCVVEYDAPSGAGRMSRDDESLWDDRDVGMRFNVHVTERTGDARSAKEIAAALAEEITKVFGGHPTDAPSQTLTLDNGYMLLMDYQNDVGVRDSDNTYAWLLSYILRVDVPVMI